MITRKEPAEDPERIITETDSLVLKQGEYSQAAARFMPQPCAAVLIYRSDAESVAAIDDSGVIYAAGPGTTTLHIQAATAEEVSAEITITVESAD